ncbi:uncharacterized protein SAPINGB_P000136 [Magnusiomyces paraingens]|uniref:MARVEL domain-containing protein n=1 Tax=Magnusiomyces paraingens TaxID=2606893 RepID=A0A5E8AXL1_9ASCO|nr:uncharacterized protein SAPINGB_P000136 [Saprochaete ingens]VVT43767.1 unnamed protein product [Saprochaete ingens]
MTDPKLTPVIVTQPLFVARIIQFFASIGLLIISAIIVEDINSTLVGSSYIWYYGGSYKLRGRRVYYSDIVSTFTFSWTIMVTALFMFLPTNFKELANPTFFFIIEILTNALWIATWVYLSVFSASLRGCDETVFKLIFADTIASSIIWVTFLWSTVKMMKSSIGYYSAKGYKLKIPFIPGGSFPDIPKLNSDLNSGVPVDTNSESQLSNIMTINVTPSEKNINSVV